MKLRIYIIVNLLLFSLLSAQKVYSCWGPWYAPKDYHTFRIYEEDKQLYTEDEYGRPKLKSEVILNCELWQKLVGEAIPVKDIYEAIYKSTYEDILRIPQLIALPNAKDSLMQNQFVKWVVGHKDREIAEFLLLAKLCEKIRWEQSSPWYYPTENDHVSLILTDVAVQAQAYAGKRLQDRYALQAIRALFATAQYDKCINYWNDMHDKLPDGLLKKMIRPYVAGAYFRTGAIEKAKQIYAECGDVNSLLYCAGKQGKQTNEIEQMELVYKYCPNSPMLAQTAQRLIQRVESFTNCWCDVNNEWPSCLPLYEFSLKVALEGKTANPAMWYYTAAYLSDQNGDTQTALNLLAKAEKSYGTSYIRESIMILRIYLDAKTCRYNIAYEQRLLEQLRWLDNKIRDNIDDKVRQKTISNGFWGNYNYYYWNDMLRKIVLSVVVPRYIAHGNYIRAIQLANMADNNLLNVINKQEFYYCYDQTWDEDIVSLSEYRKGKKWHNCLDYSNALFALIDTIGVNHVIAYVQRLQQPSSDFDRFINDRSYVDTDFFNELIGTQCLREMRYADALKYFGKIPSSFQYRLNTYKDGYMKYDPFSWHAMSLISNNTDYKYNFTREMYSLEQSINRTKEPNRKAQLQIRYAIGLENSINRCWALTQYYRGELFWGLGHVTNLDWTKRTSWKRANAKSERLIKESLAMFTDRESAAYTYWLLGNNTKIMSDYPDTNIGEYVRSRCDNLGDYTVR